MITSEKRKEIEKLVHDVTKAFDPTGRNTERYKKLFAGMNDKQFEDYIKRLDTDKDFYPVLQMIDYETKMEMKNFENALDVMKVPLFEYIVFPHYNGDKENPVVTKEKVLVGYCHVKRTQQTLIKKNGMSTSIAKRSMLTGQVTSEDRNGKESDLENFMLTALGSEYILKELNGPRSDDIAMKEQMLKDINTNGYVTLEDLDSDTINKTTLNTVDVFLLGMGVKSDLVTKGLMLKSTLKEQA